MVYASDGDVEEHRRFAATHGLEDSEYVLSTDLGLRFAVAKLPYAVLLDANGDVRAKGIVNTREHLESLFEADRLGVASVQAYLARQARRQSVGPNLEEAKLGIQYPAPTRRRIDGHAHELFFCAAIGRVQEPNTHARVRKIPMRQR